MATERELLGRMLDDAQAHLGIMVNHLMASVTDPTEIYQTGLHTTPLLFSLAEVVVAWLLLRQGEVAAPRVGDDPFYAGKIETVRFFVRSVAPQVAARRAAAEAEDGSLMDLPIEAF